MAQNKNSKSSERVVKKLYDAVFISPFRSKTRSFSHQYAQPQESFSASDVPHTNSPAKTSPFQSKQDHFVHQQSIPSDSEPPFAYFPARKFEKEDDDPMYDRSDEREAMFSDYISKVKNHMMKTESSVGVGRIPTRRGSFNNKVTSYINRAKLKIRTTSNVGDHKSFSFK